MENLSRRSVARWTLRVGAAVAVAVAMCAAPSSAEETAESNVGTEAVLMAPLGHTGMVLSVAFSPDGRYVLTGSDDATAQLWETATGRVVRRFEGHTGGVSSVAFSPDGTQVLTGSYDKTVRLWEAASGQVVQRLAGHAGPVYAVAFSADGAHVLTGSADKVARLWDTGTGAVVQRYEANAGAVQSLAFSPDGLHVLTGTRDGTARLWEKATGTEVRRYEGKTDGVRSVAFSPDGSQFLAGSFDKAARLWDTATGQELRRFEGRRHTMGSLSVAFSSDGMHVLAGSRDGTTHLWEAATGREIQVFPGHDGDVYAAAFSPDGAYVLTGSYDRTTRLWATATGKEVRRFEGRTRAVSSVAFSPDGEYLLTGSRDHTAQLWETATGRAARRLTGHTAAVLSVAFTPDGRYALTGSVDTSARLWETLSGREIHGFVGHTGAVHSVACSPDGGTVLTGSDDKTARLWETATGRAVRSFEGHTAAVHAVAFSPDGRYVLTGARDGTARLWRMSDGAVVQSFAGHQKWVTSVAFSPDGTYVLTGSWDRTARLWEVATGREVRRFEKHTLGPIAVAFSPDSSRVLTGSFDETAWLWEAATGKPLHHLVGHTGAVHAVAFSPDGRQALTGSGDGTTGLWDVRSGRELCSLLSFTDGTSAVVDVDGRFDASNGGDIPGLHWVVGMEVIALDQLKSGYYEPGLLSKHLGKNDEPLREVQAFKAPKLCPHVEVEQENGAMRVRVEDQGGGIGRIVILVNGKECTADARAEGTRSGTTLTLTRDLNVNHHLLPGEENHIEVFAYNEEGYLRSRGRLVAYAPAGKKQKTSLWAIVAGVSDYRGDGLDLKFAAKDAGDFAAAVTMAGAKLFGAERTHVTLLSDASASREALLAALEDARRARTGDILLIYLAGHGISRGEGFYYLTAGAETADVEAAGIADAAQAEATALSSAELIEAIKRVPALKQVLILDTCASGSFIDALAGKRAVPSSQVRALERVKDRTGTFVLAGCAADKVSYEATQYGQGLLTYSLLLAMKGGHLRDHQYVDVSMLFDFAADKVGEFARQIGGVQQPVVAVPGGGSSFDIGWLTEKEKAGIRLQGALPLFRRSNFQDADEGADVLSLAHHVDDALSHETARGRDASLVYVDARQFPGAFQIAGTYTTKDGTTTVRFKLRSDRAAVTDWIELTGPAGALPRRIVEEARRHIPTERR